MDNLILYTKEEAIKLAVSKQNTSDLMPTGLTDAEIQKVMSRINRMWEEQENKLNTLNTYQFIIEMKKFYIFLKPFGPYKFVLDERNYN